MMNRNRSVLSLMVAATAALGASGCDDFLKVDNPTVIDAATVDPVQDAPTFSQSALNNLWDAFDDAIVYGAWFSGEAWEGDTFPTRTDIGRRNIDADPETGSTNGTLDDEIWSPLSRAIATGERVPELLGSVANPERNPEILRAMFASAYGILFQAELFCQVVISSGLDNLGTPLTSNEGMAQAEARFRQIITRGDAIATTESRNLANAARVGLARALLFQGKNAEAATVAGQVPAGFVLLAPKVDDPSNRAALGNTVYSFTLSRNALVVPPYFRQLNDARVTSALGPAPTWVLKAQDGNLDFYRQTKFTGWGDDIRLASELEARYIAAEAQLKLGNPAPALALIAERQAAGGAGAASGDDIDFVSTNSTLVDLLDQKARDFYLEGTHMGDWRRNPTSTPYVPSTGSQYYSEAGVFGNQTCMPLPDDEVLNNPGFRQQ